MLSPIWSRPPCNSPSPNEPRVREAFAELGTGSLAIGIALVGLIPFLRKLITDKAETPPIEAATVVPFV